jgi:monoamine oxidase
MIQIAIVGGGLAGLNAALTLQDAGLACTLYEASGRTGGRIHSDATTWADGMVSEWCGEFIDAQHTTMHQLIRRFGLRTVDMADGRAGGRTDQARSVLYFRQRYYRAEELAQDFAALAPLLQQQFQAAGFPTTYARSTPEGVRLDHLSVYKWIEQYVKGGHTAALGHLLDQACSGLYGLESSEQSALNLVYLFGAPGALGGSIAAGPLPASGKIVGGNEQLPLAIARSLPPGCIHLHHQLVALEQSSEAAPTPALTLTFAVAGGTRQVQCDCAILALPFSALRHVEYWRAGFDRLKRTAIEELGYGTISKLFLEFDRPYWYEPGPWPHPANGFVVTDLDIQTLWDTGRGQPGAGGLLVDYTSGRRGAAYAPPAAYTTTAETAGAPQLQQYARNCLRQLETVFPGISAHYTGKAALSYPTGDPFLRGSYACWRVGQYTRFGGYEGVRQGAVHFAGEHCSVEFQGFMEGAAREGARAAGEIVQDVASARYGGNS